MKFINKFLMAIVFVGSVCAENVFKEYDVMDEEVKDYIYKRCLKDKEEHEFKEHCLEDAERLYNIFKRLEILSKRKDLSIHELADVFVYVEEARSVLIRDVLNYIA